MKPWNPKTSLHSYTLTSRVKSPKKSKRDPTAMETWFNTMVTKGMIIKAWELTNRIGLMELEQLSLIKCTIQNWWKRRRKLFIKSQWTTMWNPLIHFMIKRVKIMTNTSSKVTITKTLSTINMLQTNPNYKQLTTIISRTCPSIETLLTSKPNRKLISLKKPLFKPILLQLTRGHSGKEIVRWNITTKWHKTKSLFTHPTTKAKLPISYLALKKRATLPMTKQSP